MPNVMTALLNIGSALCSMPQFGWRGRLECRAVTLPRGETHWNLQGCPKLANGSQPLLGWSSPYYEDMWRRYCCLTSFFPIVDRCLSCQDIARQSCAMVPKWRFFASCISSEPRAAHFRPAFCNDDVKVVSVHVALGLSVHASLLCMYEQQSNSLSGGVRLPADWWSRARSTLWWSADSGGGENKRATWKGRESRRIEFFSNERHSSWVLFERG